MIEQSTMLLEDGALEQFLASHPDAFVTSIRRASRLGDAIHARTNFVVEDATLGTAVECAAAIEASPAECIVAIGGGVVMDVTKIAARLTFSDGVCEAVRSRRVPGDALAPHRWLVLVPATIGSGSEASQVAVLEIDGKKVPLHHETFYPDQSILDPRLVQGLPPAMVTTGLFDAVAHCVESFASPIATADSRAASDAAWHVLSAVIPNVIDSRLTDELAAQALLGAYHAGTAQSVASCGLAHALAHALEPVLQLSHRELVARYLGPVLKFNMSRVDAYEALLGSDGLDRLQYWLRRAALHVPPQNVDWNDDLKRTVQRDPCYKTNPTFIRRKELDQLLVEFESG